MHRSRKTKHKTSCTKRKNLRKFCLNFVRTLKKWNESQSQMMSSVYNVTEINGKGLGCVAIADIKKGSLILNEYSQIVQGEEIDWSFKWIKSLLKSFNQMSKTDQLEYMKLYSKFNNIQNFENFSPSTLIQNSCKEFIDKNLDNLKLEIGKIEQNTEKAKDIFKICCIYSSNSFVDGSLRIKLSRFNHSCQANAALIDGQVRAIGNIKAGKEININYIDDPFVGFKCRKDRQKILFGHWLFLCSCELCENDVDIDANAYKAYIEDAEKLTIARKSAYKAGRSLASQCYSLENYRKEILCYKQLYSIGKSKSQNIQPYFLYKMLDQGFRTAISGFGWYRAADLKDDARAFAKAAEKFGKILGNDIANTENIKKVYTDLIDKAGY